MSSSSENEFDEQESLNGDEVNSENGNNSEPEDETGEIKEEDEKQVTWDDLVCSSCFLQKPRVTYDFKIIGIN